MGCEPNYAVAGNCAQMRYFFVMVCILFLILSLSYSQNSENEEFFCQELSWSPDGMLLTP